MVRTRNTAKILRALDIQATTSSSSSSENDVSDDEGLRASMGSDYLYGCDGVPNAHNTDDINERMQVPDSDDGGSVETQTVGEGSHSRASSQLDDSGTEKCSDVTSSGSRKREYAECDDKLYFVPPLRKYHKSWKDLEKCIKKY